MWYVSSAKVEFNVKHYDTFQPVEDIINFLISIVNINVMLLKTFQVIIFEESISKEMYVRDYAFYENTKVKEKKKKEMQNVI